MNNKKRNWFITGISSGIGKALAEVALKKGDFVMGTFRNQSQVNEFNKTHAGKGFAFLLDVTDYASIEKVVQRIEKDFLRVDVLVNNAGIGLAGAVEESSMEEARKIFEVNFFSVLKITNEFLPLMRKQRSGHIIQISSHGGLKAFAGFGIYNASKFALEGFSEALAQEIDPLGIKLSIVEPGPFRTNFAGKELGLAKKIIEDYSPTAGAFRKKLKGVHEKQEGHPQKAAKAIFDLVESDNPSLRLPLGKIALKTIKMKLDSVAADLEKNRKVAEGAVFDD